MKAHKHCLAGVAVCALLLAVAIGTPVSLASGWRPDSLPADIQKAYASGAYGRASDLLQDAVERNPKDASLYHWLARCYYETRDFDHAISNWERAVNLDSTQSEYHDWLGRAYGRKADLDSHTKMASALSLARKTHHEFEVAVQLDAKNVDAQRDLIAFMASAPSNLGGGEDRALAQIRTLSGVDALEGRLALADFYSARKQFEQADGEYQQILKSAPPRIDAYFEAADYYRTRDDAEHTRQAVEGALQVDQSDRRVYYYRGVSLVLAKKDSDIAEKELRTYIQTVPENSELPSHSSAYEYLGRLYENEGKSDVAAEQYKAALELDPQNKALREMLKKMQKK